MTEVDVELFLMKGLIQFQPFAHVLREVRVGL